LVWHLRQIVITGLVTGLVSRINMIRRPDLLRQVAVLNTLAVEKLKTKQDKYQVGHAAASRKSAKQRKLTNSGGDARSKGGSPQFQFSGMLALVMLFTRRATWALESSTFDVRVGSSRPDMCPILWTRLWSGSTRRST
jgi:hypothetical protein